MDVLLEVLKDLVKKLNDEVKIGTVKPSSKKGEDAQTNLAAIFSEVLGIIEELKGKGITDIISYTESEEFPSKKETITTPVILLLENLGISYGSKETDFEIVGGVTEGDAIPDEETAEISQGSVGVSKIADLPNIIKRITIPDMETAEILQGLVDVITKFDFSDKKLEEAIVNIAKEVLKTMPTTGNAIVDQVISAASIPIIWSVIHKAGGDLAAIKWLAGFSGENDVKADTYSGLIKGILVKFVAEPLQERINEEKKRLLVDEEAKKASEAAAEKELEKARVDEEANSIMDPKI